jgi:hypothetical protein
MEIVLDASSLNTFSECPRRYYYRYVKHLVAAGQMMLYADFGRAVHTALAHYFKGFDLGEAVDLGQGEYAAALREAYGAVDKVPYNLADLRTALECYVQRFPRESDQFQTAHVEVTFAIPRGRFTLIGRIDKVDQCNGRYWIRDYKTTSRPWSYMVNPNFQLDCYLYGCQTTLGVWLDGAILDTLTKRSNGTWDIDRKFTTWSPERRNAFLQDLSIKSDLIAHYLDTNYFPRNTIACYVFGACSYHALCVCETREAEDAVIESLYEVRPWRPGPEGPAVGVALEEGQ